MSESEQNFVLNKAEEPVPYFSREGSIAEATRPTRNEVQNKICRLQPIDGILNILLSENSYIRISCTRRMNDLKSMRQYLSRIGQLVWSNPLRLFQHLNTRNFKILIRAIRQEPTGLIIHNFLQLLETGKGQVAHPLRFVGDDADLKIYLLHCRKEAGVLIVLVWVLSKNRLDEAWMECEGKKLADFQDTFVKPQLSTSFSEFEDYQQQGLVFQIATLAPLPACSLSLKDFSGKKRSFPIGEMSTFSSATGGGQDEDLSISKRRCIVLLHDWGNQTDRSLSLDRLQSLVLESKGYANQVLISMDPNNHPDYLQKVGEGPELIALENINRYLKGQDFEHLLVLPVEVVLSTHFFSTLDTFLKTNPAADLVYFDEGLYESDGRIHSLHLKPAFSPDLLAVDNYIGASFCVSKAALEAVDWFSASDFVAGGYDFLLRSLGTTPVTYRAPDVFVYAADYEQELYLERAAIEAQIRMDHFQVRDILVHSSELIYPIKDTPLVSIIIPFKDRLDLLQRCIESILDKTAYPHFEILLISNNSIEKETFAYLDRCCAEEKRLRWLAWDEPFNYSALNNWAVQQAKGSALLFLNNDIEVLSESWLSKMLGYLQQDKIGAVGAKLLYPDSSVQHAGVIVGIGGVAAHAHKHYPDRFASYQGRANKVQNVSACTAACLLVRRSAFDEVGGFDAINLPIAFNDIDLCLKIKASGYRIIYHSGVKLYHYESISRGAEDTWEKRERAKGEIDFFRKKWANLMQAGDPYYHPGLSIIRADFEVDGNGLGQGAWGVESGSAHSM